MKNLIALLLLIHYSAGYTSFSSLSITADNKDINAQTTYSISVQLGSFGEDVPSDFTLVMVLPNKLSVIDSVGTNPSTCILQDSNGASDYSLTSAYDSANPQSGQCGVSGTNTYTLITPNVRSRGLNFQIGKIQNPNASYSSTNIGSIQFYGYKSGSTNPDYQGSQPLSDYYFTVGTLTSISLTQGSVAIGAWNTYTFSFYLENNIPSGAIVIFTFNSNFSLSTASNTAVTGQINGGSSINLNCDITGQVLTVYNLFSSNLVVTSGSTYLTISIVQVRNLRYIGSADISVATAVSSTEYIDKMTINASSSTSCEIEVSSFTSSAKYVLTSTTLTIAFKQGNYAASASSAANAYSIRLVIPTTFTLSSTFSCTKYIGIDPSYSTISCTNQGGGIVTTNLISQNSNIVAINLLNVILPPNSKTTDYIQISTYTEENTSGSKMCENTQFATYSATPNAITVSSKTRRSSYVGDLGPYTLTFKTTTQMPQNSYIKLVLPMAQVVENSGIVCYEILSGTIQTSNVCTKSSTPSDSTTYELYIPEWCSTTSTGCTGCCSGGTELSVSIDGVVNPYYVNSNTGTSVKIYTLNPTQDGIIDDVTSGLEFTPSLVAKSISSTSMTRDANIVGQDIKIDISHTSTVIYIQNSQVVYSFPASFIYSASSNVKCTNLGTNTDTTCSFTTNSSDGSISTVTVSNLCTSNCASGQTYKIRIYNIQNAITVAQLTNPSYTVSAYYSSYLIESGAIDSSALVSLDTGTITSIKAYRSTNSIKSSITMWISFIHPTMMKSTGVITISFPSLMVYLKTSLSVFRYSDNTQLTISTSNDGANSITGLTITNYCASTCAGGGNITIAMTGIKNLDYLQTITGSLTITTSDSNSNSDTGTVSDITTILAPLETGAITEIDLHPTNPTISETTDYRIIFTTFNDIPAGATIKTEFPSGVSLSSTSTTTCTSFINIYSGLSCAVSGSALTLSNGFPSGVTGQIQVGFVASNIANGASTASSYGPFKISTVDTTGYLIDAGSTTFTYLSYKASSDCSTDCKTCAGTSGTQCYSCKNPSSKPILLGYSCVATCPDGYYLTSSTPLTCLSCYYTCKTCLGPQSSDCTSCESGYYKSGGSCVTPCPSGSTLNSNNICVNDNACTSPCASCSGSSTFCLSCDPNSSTPVLDPERGECVTEETPTEDYCPTGYYEDSNKICQKCSTNCAECYSSSTHCTSCPSIYTYKYLNKLDNTCVSSCPALISVQDDTNLVCNPCDSSCATCNGVNANNCLSCYSTNKKYLTADNQCVATCPANYYNFHNTTSGSYKCIASCPTSSGYYIDSTNTYCNECMTTCSTCSNGSTCTSCSTSTPYLNDQSICEADCTSSEYKYTENGNKKCYSVCPSGTSHYTDSSSKKWCLSTCPNGYYASTSGTATSGQSNSFCTACDTTCATCSGGGKNSCLTCSSSSTYPYKNENNECVEACSSSEYTNTLNGKMECVTSCPSGSYQLTDKSGKKWCSSSCGDGYYVQKVSSTVNNCNPCDTTCQTCSGGSTTNCLTCTQQYPYLNEKNQCESSCSSNEYTYALNGKTRCYYTCPSDTYQWIDTSGKKWCTDTCPNGYYIQKVSDSVTNCNACYTTCQTCDGGKDSDCLTCSQSYPYINEDNQCEKNCSSIEYTYELNDLLKCYTICPAGTYNTNSSSGIASCTTSCEKGSYVDTVSTSDSTKSGDYCEPCPQDCLLCSSKVECEDCKDKHSLPNTVNTTISICYGWSPPGPATHLGGYVIYALIFETILIAILIFISKFKNTGYFDATATVLFMSSIIEFTEKLMLLIFLWVEYGPHADIFVAITGSMLVGSLLISMMYQNLHFDSLVESSETLEVFSSKNKWAFRIVRCFSFIFGIHFLRIFYSGFMGFAIATNAKTLGNVNAFRFPLEKLCVLNLALVCIPMLLEQAAIMALFDVETNPWQISLFGVVLNICIEGLFLWDYFRGPWRF
ncbi:unnamed protein product [Blepharisma stoltei]|uniref:TNFR-Cys domain-containing protein n=1 Tax=Blepharisma stoltei TaxID=1481888 RepID=A0AAU9IEN5_9CILI|nr:unnamed protein product [Blepharisma stoltei]